MPLERYLDGEAHVLPADDNLIRFGMNNGERVIGVEVPITVLREVFGGADADLCELYGRNRDAIEAAASRAYDKLKLPNDLMQMGREDFDTRDAEERRDAPDGR